MTMLEKHMIDLLNAIEESYKNGWYMPCLVLLYSGLDVVASLEPSRGSGVGDRFEKWVDRYMLRSYPLPCTARDLYAARCAVVHTFTPESDLSRKGKARVIGYGFGSAAVTELDKASAFANQSGQVNVHVRDLIDAFRNGFADYYQEVTTDGVRLAEMENSAGLWSGVMGPEVINEYVRINTP